LSFLFSRTLQRVRPKSIAILGGAGLEHVDDSISRVEAVDINALATGTIRIAPVDLVHAPLTFEQAGLERALDNALALVAPGGALSVVLHLPSTAVAFDVFREVVELRGFDPSTEEAMAIPDGKALWLGIFLRA
jgi:hypothetical protein